MFLRELSQTANVREACEKAVVCRATAYAHRERDPKFKAAWDSALEDACDRMEREAYRRAVEGVDEPVFYQGEECGAIRRYSDSLLTTLLKANRPEKFRENATVKSEISGPNGGPIDFETRLKAAYGEPDSKPA